MIKIEHIHTCNWEAAIRGMRNPLNSWDKSDSFYCNSDIVIEPSKANNKCDRVCPYWNLCDENHIEYILGPNDLNLAKQLATAGSDHGKFLRQIIFSCDITAPMYWWKEMDTYKVGTVRNSCSTMHKIMDKDFEMSDFSWDKTGFLLLEVRKEEGRMLDLLNSLRHQYLIERDDEMKKKLWYALIQYLPSSYNQKATWTANYEVLRNIYHARKNHKLDEWHVFCDMIEKLPYSELITEERK